MDLRNVLVSDHSRDRIRDETNAFSLDANRRLEYAGLCPETLCVRPGTTALAEHGSDPYVSWGRWTGGDVHVTGSAYVYRAPYTSNQGMHYLVGSPALGLPTQGRFSYSLVGATQPTFSDGSTSPGSFAGRIGVQFAPGSAARIGIEAQVRIGGGTYAIATSGGVSDPSASELQLSSTARFEGSLRTQASGVPHTVCAGQSCTTQVRGGLFGPGGLRAGYGYTIRDPGSQRTIDGVGVFARDP
ncbi:MAG: hypothetical protein R3E48_13570 [Burkholderiaceae bacterium]